MEIAQYRVPATGPLAATPTPLGGAHLVLAFGPSAAGGAPDAAWFEALAARYPDAVRVYCSTAGHLADVDVCPDGEVALTAVRFEHARVRAARVPVADAPDARALGRALAAALPAEGLRHVLVFADGQQVHGGAFVRGLADGLPAGVHATGGLAGDDDRFGATAVALDGPPAGPAVVAVGLYGDRLVVGAGACGGWTHFGPDRVVTRAEGNVLYELDGEPALALYRRYLGPYADALPGSGLLFPLALRTSDGDTGVVRTVAGVDEAAGSVRFFGDVPEGMIARLMKASADRIIDGAGAAAELAAETAGAALGESDTLALLVSCCGRRWLLGQRTEEELDAARAALGARATLAGFYSYGEVAPLGRLGSAALHNQTMTVTLLGER